MKYLIVDISGRWAAGLDENGAVTRIPDRGYAIGDTAELPARRYGSVRGVIRRAAIAAAAAVMASAIGVGAAYATPCGTVSLDASPSIEYTINCFNYVIGVTAVNEEGEELLESLKGSLKNHSIGEAVAAAVTQIGEEGYFDDGAEVLIAVGTRSESHSEELTRQLDNVVEKEMNRPARTVTVTMDDVKQAHREHTTGGRRWESMQDVPEKPEGDAAPVPPDGEQAGAGTGTQASPPTTPTQNGTGTQASPPPTPAQNGTGTQASPPPTQSGTGTQASPPPTQTGTGTQPSPPPAQNAAADPGTAAEMPPQEGSQTSPPPADDMGAPQPVGETGDRGGSSGG